MTETFSNIDVARRPPTETDTAYEYPCPLCECAARTPDDLQSHLLVSHRKSQLAEALLDRSAKPRGADQSAGSRVAPSP